MPEDPTFYERIQIPTLALFFDPPNVMSNLYY